MKPQCLQMHRSGRRQKDVKRKICLWKKGDFDKVRTDISEFVHVSVQMNIITFIIIYLRV